MKCEVTQCQEEAQPDRLYCRYHGSARASARVIDSIEEVGSGFKENGGISGPLGRYGRTVSIKGSDLINSEANGPEKIENDNEKINGIGMPAIQREAARKYANENSDTTRSMGSTPVLTPVEEANSISLSLVDESTKHLLELQRSIRGDGEISADKINAACNCAKQIASLQRLKIEAFKAMKK